MKNQLRSSFLSSRWFSFQLTFNVIRRSSWDPHPLNNFIDPTFFSVFDKILILHIRKGQFRIWEALYENNLLTPLSFWSFVGFKIYFENNSPKAFWTLILKRTLWVVRVLFITSWTQSLFKASTTLNIKFKFYFHNERLCGEATRWRS